MTLARPWIRPAAALLAALLAAGCASQAGPAATADSSPAAAAAPAAASSDTASAGATAGEDGSVRSDRPSGAQYVIGAGDTLGISVYRAPELSVPSLPVRPDGRISLPLIPDIVAAGKTPTQLGKEIEEKLKEYVKDPIVTVMVTSFVGPFSRQVRVIGAATEPMAIPYRDNMTVLDVMIATKGLTKFAAGNRAMIVRNVDGKRETIKVRLDDLLKDGDINQNVPMMPGDTLIIPESWF
jgi:polysaccharide export outer membrane protein